MQDQDRLAKARATFQSLNRDQANDALKDMCADSCYRVKRLFKVSLADEIFNGSPPTSWLAESDAANDAMDELFVAQNMNQYVYDSLENVKARNFSLRDDTGLRWWRLGRLQQLHGRSQLTRRVSGRIGGCVPVYQTDARHGAGSVFLQYAAGASQRTELVRHMAVGARYLLSLLNVTTGEVHHEYCRDFDHPTEDSCRTNHVGYGGPHHSATAMMGLQVGECWPLLPKAA
jgi:hypothetical protein